MTSHLPLMRARPLPTHHLPPGFSLISALCLIFLYFLGLTNVQAGILTAHISNPDGKPVADAVIYAISKTANAKATSTASIEQQDREFVPYVSVVQTGTTVSFPNRDILLHHVYSFSPAKTFEIKLYSGEAPRSLVFDKPGIVTLGCNIHDWMIAYLLVVDTPYFAKSNAQGVAVIANLPSSSYQLKTWHPNQRGIISPQNINLTDKADVTINVTVGERKQKLKPPLDPLRYP